jgi:hypothetical protein
VSAERNIADGIRARILPSPTPSARPHQPFLTCLDSPLVRPQACLAQTPPRNVRRCHHRFPPSSPPLNPSAPTPHLQLSFPPLNIPPAAIPPAAQVTGLLGPDALAEWAALAEPSAWQPCVPGIAGGILIILTLQVCARTGVGV